MVQGRGGGVWDGELEDGPAGGAFCCPEAAAMDILVVDAGIAVLVSLHVLWSGWSVIRESTSGLMDETAPPEELARIREVISMISSNAIEAHDLRTRHAGKTVVVQPCGMRTSVSGSRRCLQAPSIAFQIPGADPP
jgi:divalent metal cation (Fe/Co/Zn/Cd) transporter